MKAPKEIYVHEVSAQELSEPKLNEYHIKYIRADIAELTWEDMSRIDEIIHDVRFDFRNKTITSQEYYEEALRRFNKEKKK